MNTSDDNEALFAWWDEISKTDLKEWLAAYKSLTKEQLQLIEARSEAARIRALAEKKAKRDKLDDDVYWFMQKGLTKAQIARELGFKNPNQLARSFHEAELRKRDEEIAELMTEIAKLKGGSE